VIFTKEEQLFLNNKIYRLPASREPNIEVVRNMIDYFEATEKHRLIKLKKYHVGEHDIRKRKFEHDDSKPNNRLVHNFPKVITNQLSSFFMGTSPNYTCMKNDTVFLEQLEVISKVNQEDAHNLRMANTMSVFGRAFELCYVEGNQLKYAELPVNECFIIYDTEIVPKPLFAVHFQMLNNWNGTQARYIKVYSATHRYDYLSVIGERHVQEIAPQPHNLGRIPLICYQNNTEMMGDWETSIEIIDAYNSAQSDTTNDMNYFADAYLVITGMPDTDEESVQNMKRDRVISIPDLGGDAKFLTKTTDYQSSETFKSRLKDDIFTMSGALDMDKLANTSHISGTAIKQKLLATESVVNEKEHYFREGLAQRLAIITHFLNLKGHHFDPSTLQLNFVRSLPTDLQGLAEFGSKLTGVLSRRTLLSQMDFVEDPEREMALIAEERQELQQALGVNYELGE